MFVESNIRIMFIESNIKDAYCALKSSRDVDAFMNIHQLKVTQIWNMRLNEYLKYWSLKALKSVSVTLYKLQMLQNWLQSRNNITANSKFKLTRSNFDHESNNRSRLSSSSESSSSFSSSSFSSSFSKKPHNKQFVKKMLQKQLIVKSKTDDRKMKLIRVSFESY